MKLKDIQIKINEEYMEMLDKEVIPWQTPWQPPVNIASGYQYTGGNNVILSAIAKTCNDPRFMTRAAVEAAGGKVNGDGHTISFYGAADLKTLGVFICRYCTNSTKGKCSISEDKKNQVQEEAKKDVNDRTICPDFVKKKEALFLRQYQVWNITETTLDSTNYDVPISKSADQATADRLIAGSGIKVKNITDEKCTGYDMSADEINIMPRTFYKSPDEYYYHIFKMLIHATGHSIRLKRKSAKYSNTNLGYEALTASMGAVMLCSYFGMTAVNIKQTPHEIENWKTTIKNNSSYIVMAGHAASAGIAWLFDASKIEAKAA